MSFKRRYRKYTIIICRPLVTLCQRRFWLIIVLIFMFAVMCWDFYSPSASTSDEKSSLDLGSEQFLIEQDGRMATAFNQTREWYPKNSIFEQFMIYVIKYGKDFFWIPAGILLSLLVRWTGRKTAATMALSFIIAALIVIPAKDLVGRERPTVDISGGAERVLEHRSEYSLPSGHASLVSAGTVVSLMLFRGTKWKTIGSILLAIEAAVVSFASVYGGASFLRYIRRDYHKLSRSFTISSNREAFGICISRTNN